MAVGACLVDGFVAAELALAADASTVARLACPLILQCSTLEDVTELWKAQRQQEIEENKP